MGKITIVTVNWFSADYILAMLKNLSAKAGHPENLFAAIVDNTNGQDRALGKLKKIPIKHRIYYLENRGLKGSRGHALALDFAVKKLQTEFSLIVDPDVYVFMKNWDEFCISELSKQNAIAIGAPYPVWKVGKYHDFPSPPFCFFHTHTLQNMENGWAPYGDTVFQNARIFCIRQIGRLGNRLTRKRYEKSLFLRRYAALMEKRFGVFSQDTGWKLAQEAREKGLKTIVFDSVLPYETNLKFENEKGDFLPLSKQYELFAFKHQAIMTHKYGSGGSPWMTEFGNDEIYWRNCIQRIERAAV